MDLTQDATNQNEEITESPEIEQRVQNDAHEEIEDQQWQKHPGGG